MAPLLNTSNIIKLSSIYFPCCVNDTINFAFILYTDKWLPVYYLPTDNSGFTGNVNCNDILPIVSYTLAHYDVMMNNNGHDEAWIV